MEQLLIILVLGAQSMIDHTQAHPSPDYHLSHLISSAELLVIDPNDRDDPRYVLHKVLVCDMQAGEVVQRDGRLTLSFTHFYPSLALLGSHVKVDD